MFTILLYQWEDAGSHDAVRLAKVVIDFYAVLERGVLRFVGTSMSTNLEESKLWTVRASRALR